LPKKGGRSAQADGFGYSVRLDRKADVPRVVQEFMEYPGPAFLEVIIDPDAGVYPMVGPGMAYDQMITGDFIPNRTNNKDPGTPSGSSMF
jgi:acetolactate synthase-1/2/3 large subunit